MTLPNDRDMTSTMRTRDQLTEQIAQEKQAKAAREVSVFEPVTPPAPTPERFTEMQSAFLEAFCSDDPELRGQGEASAIAAGYAPENARNASYRNLLKPRVQEEILRRVKAQSGTALMKAMDRAVRIIEHSKDDAAAARVLLGLMDRLGMAPPRGPSVNVNVTNNSVDAAGAFSILAQVVQAREQRLNRIGPAHLSGIYPSMPDTIEQPSEGGGGG